MKLLLLILIVVGGCGQKQVDWYPRVSGWTDDKACLESNGDNAERIAKKELEFCRPGKGLIIHIKGAL